MKKKEELENKMIDPKEVDNKQTKPTKKGTPKEQSHKGKQMSGGF
jgi:hypothetical protein